MIYPTAKIISRENFEMGDRSQIDDFCFINAGQECVLGSNVHISSFCSVIGGGKFFMGDFSGLSAGCRIITGSDDFSGPYLSNPTVPDSFKNVTLSFVSIGKHSIIGTNCVVYPGVKIGDGVAVSAGSVIRKDLESWCVYAEVKGKLVAISKRSRDEIIAKESEYLSSLRG